MEKIKAKEGQLNLVELMKECLSHDEILTPPSVHWGIMESEEPVRFLYTEGVEEPMMDKDFKLENTLDYLKSCPSNYVYVNFSNAYVGDPIACINGEEYNYPDGTEYFDPLFGYDASVGYVIQFDDGNYVINTGIYTPAGGCCSGPFWYIRTRITLCEDCMIFNTPMEKFIKKFIL